MRIPLNAGALILVTLASGPAAAADSELAGAVEQRNAVRVAALLKQRVDVNAPQADGATALHWAAHWNDLSTARALVAGGARVNAANDYGMTPLFLAATNGSTEMVQLLLDAGASPSGALPSGETVLMTAVRSGSLPSVKTLLAAGADANAVQLSRGQTALMWAAARGARDIARALLERGENVNARSTSGFTPLMFAAREGTVDVSRLLLDANADINANAADGSTALLVATVRGHVDLAALLLDRGARPDGDADGAGYTPLHWAAVRYEHPLTNSQLRAPGEWEALAGIPDRQAKLALIKALVARGANIQARLTKPLPSPSRFGGGSARLGSTPFLVAATAGDADVMRLLLAQGADPQARDREEQTALMVAAGGGSAYALDAVRVPESDRIDAISVALAAGNELEAQDRKGYRAMHVATASEFHGIIRFLLDKGADLNAVTNSRREKEGRGFVIIAGQSPLGIVEGTFTGGTYNERPATAEFLRKLGAKSIGKATLESYLKTFQAGDGVPAPAPNEQPTK